MSDRATVHKVLEVLLAEPRSEVRLIAHLAKYVAANPQDHKALLWYGDSLRLVGRCKEAIELLTSQFDCVVNPSDKLAFAVRIAMALETTDRKQAEYWFSVGAELDWEASGWLWVLRGQNLAFLERFDEAIQCYTVALKSSDVDLDEAYRHMALAHRAKGDYAKAKEWLLRAKKLIPARDRRMIGEIQEVLDDLENAGRGKRPAAAVVAEYPGETRH